MRFAFFNSYTLWGGGEKWHFTAAEYMANLGHEVFVFCDPAGELYKRVQAHPKLTPVAITITKHSYWNPLTQWSFYRTFKKLHLDSLVFNAPRDVRSAAVMARRAGIRNVIYRNGMPIPIPQKKSFIRAFQAGLTALVSISKEGKELLETASPKLSAGHQIKVIPNAFDFEKLPKKNPTPPVPKQNDEIILVSTGRLSEQKGQQYLLAACGELLRQGLRFRLWLVGAGELEQQLKQQTQELGLQQHVEFIGFQGDVYPYLHHADIFVFPSLWEGRASSIIEAMALGLPVVCFNMSSMGETVTHEQNGLLAAPLDHHDFAAQIATLMREPQLRRQYGDNGRATIEKDFNVSEIYARWLSELSR